MSARPTWRVPEAEAEAEGGCGGARLLAPETDRSDLLATVAARWAQLDPAEYPFIRQVAAQPREHDDREQFLASRRRSAASTR